MDTLLYGFFFLYFPTLVLCRLVIKKMPFNSEALEMIKSNNIFC